MEIKDLKLLIKMVTETDITEFEMDNTDEKIVIRRGQKPEFFQMAPAAQAYAPPQLPVSQQQPQQTLVPATAPAPQKESGEQITSPIVGTFYRAASPEAAPFCEVGQVLEKGQVICLVEAMKLFNEIEAEFKCKILKICVENAQPVEFGQPLFIVEKL